MLTADPASPLQAPRTGSSVRRDPRLADIAAKVDAGERLTLEDGDVLYTTPDIWGVCELADKVRRRMHPTAGYYNINRHFNYSNVCALSCKFCEFFRKPGQDGAYTRDEAYIRAEGRKAVESGATEMHIVGGLHPSLGFDYYPTLLRILKEEAPRVHLKAFTPVELVHFARLRKIYKKNDRDARREAMRQVLGDLKAAGLGSLPGGGAEVFDDRVHDKAYRGKIRSDEWLDVHLVAHELGLNSNATMLYGHIEQRGERLFHMDLLRRAQDVALARVGYTPGDSSGWEHGDAYDAIEKWQGPITLTGPGAVLPPTPPPTGRERDPDANAGVDASGQSTERGDASARQGFFQTIIPLPFFPDGSELEHLPGPSGLENLRTLAVARLMLDNFPHAKAFWIMQTLGMSQFMLQAGADDIDGTVVWYDITKVGGASTHQEVTVRDLERAITEAGFTPVERDTLYRRVTRDPRDARRWRIEA